MQLEHGITQLESSAGLHSVVTRLESLGLCLTFFF